MGLKGSRTSEDSYLSELSNIFWNEKCLWKYLYIFQTSKPSVAAQRFSILRQEWSKFKFSLEYIMDFGLSWGTETDKMDKTGVIQTVQW